MAPERLADSTADRRADVYSLTCVLYELLTGQRPFGNLASAPRLIQAHLHETPPSPTRLNPRVPPGFDEVIARGMAKDPRDRYSDVEQLLAACLHAARGRRAPATAQGDGFVSFTASQPRRESQTLRSPAVEGMPPAPEADRARLERRRPLRPVLMAVAAVLLIALGAGGALLLSSPQNTAATPSVATPTGAVTTRAPASPAASSSSTASPSAPIRYTFRLSGSARAATINWGADGSMGSATEAPLPWSKDLDANQGASYHFATLAAFTPRRRPRRPDLQDPRPDRPNHQHPDRRLPGWAVRVRHGQLLGHLTRGATARRLVRASEARLVSRSWSGARSRRSRGPDSWRERRGARGVRGRSSMRGRPPETPRVPRLSRCRADERELWNGRGQRLAASELGRVLLAWAATRSTAAQCGDRSQSGGRSPRARRATTAWAALASSHQVRSASSP